LNRYKNFIPCFMFLVSCFFVACGENYPREVWIDDNFSASEETLIVLAMNRWEEVTGRELFLYRGRIETGDFHKENLGDGVFVVYEIEKLDEGDVRLVWNFEDPGYGDAGHSGWATAGDMLIFIPGFDAKEGSRVYLRDLFGVLLHEFGHTLFLGHIRDGRAVMSPDGEYNNCPTLLDLEAFCSMNLCDQSYSPEEAEDACRAKHGEGSY